MPDQAIEVLWDEKRNFPPPKQFKKSAHARSAGVFNSARKNPQAFWAKAARELEWFKPWKKILEWKSPWAKWFIGGKINACYNSLDRHVNGMRDLTDLARFTMSMEQGRGLERQFYIWLPF